MKTYSPESIPDIRSHLIEEDPSDVAERSMRAGIAPRNSIPNSAPPILIGNHLSGQWQFARPDTDIEHNGEIVERRIPLYGGVQGYNIAYGVLSTGSLETPHRERLIRTLDKTDAFTGRADTPTKFGIVSLNVMHREGFLNLRKTTDSRRYFFEIGSEAHLDGLTLAATGIAHRIGLIEPDWQVSEAVRRAVRGELSL